MVGKRGRSSAGKGIIRLDMKLDYRLAFKQATKKSNFIKKNADHLSFTNSGDPLARTESPIVCELSSGFGRGHRPGAGRRSAMGAVGPRGTSSPQAQGASGCGQIQVPQSLTPTQHNDTIFPGSGNSTHFASRQPTTLHKTCCLSCQWGQNLCYGRLSLRQSHDSESHSCGRSDNAGGVGGKPWDERWRWRGGAGDVYVADAGKQRIG